MATNAQAVVSATAAGSRKRAAHKRADGEGTIYRRKDGLWVGDLMVGYKPDGRPDRRTVSAKTEGECRRKLQALRQQHSQGALPKERDTLAGFVERWLAATAAGVRPSTHRRYAQLLRVHVLPTLGRKRLDALRPDDVQAVLGRLLLAPARGKPGATLSPRTVRHVHTVLHTALAAAVKWGDVARNVADLVDPPRVSKPESYTPTPAECARLIAAAAGDSLAALVGLAVYTGARQGELLGLQWGDVDFDKGTLAIRRSLMQPPHGGVPEYGPPKTERSRRTLTLPPEALAALRQQRSRQLEQRMLVGPEYRDYGLIFATALGTPYIARNVGRTWKRLLAAAGLPPGVRFHDLRHAAATNSLQANIPLKVVSERLGHSTLAITADLYTHRVASLEADAAEKLAALIRAAAPGGE